MIYILLIALIMMLAIAFICSKGDILSPWVITCGVFLFCTLVASLNVNKWGFTLSPFTLIIIIGGVLAFGAGEITISHAFDTHFSHISKVQASSKEIISKRPIHIPFAVLLLVFLFMAAVVVGYFQKTYEISLLGGNPGGYDLMLKYARDYLLTPGNTIGKVYGHLTLFCKMMFYIFTFVFIYNAVFVKFRPYFLLYLVPAVLYVCIGVIGTGRTFAIEIMAYMIVACFLMVKQRNNWSNRETVIFITVAIIAVVVFLLLFTLLGYLTGKSQLRANPMEFIAYYTGMSIPSLDVYLKSAPKENVIFGQETLYGIHSILRTLGFDLPIFTAPLEFVNFNGDNGNVYTSLRRYINDYGIIGMFILQYLIGVFYSVIYKYVRYGRFSNFAIILYAFFAFALVMQPIEENLLRIHVSTNLVYSLGYLGILFYLFIYLPLRPVKEKRRVQRRIRA